MGSPPTEGFGQGSAEIARWASSIFEPEDALLRDIREHSRAAGLPAIKVR